MPTSVTFHPGGHLVYDIGAIAVNICDRSH